MSPSRLRLVDGTLALLSAALEGRNALEGLLGVSVAEEWEGFPEALPILRASYERQPEGHMWGSLFFIELEARTLVGFGGFKGPPSPDGVVEIGYAIAPAFRDRACQRTPWHRWFSALLRTSRSARSTHTPCDTTISPRVSCRRPAFERSQRLKTPTTDLQRLTSSVPRGTSPPQTVGFRAAAWLPRAKTRTAPPVRKTPFILRDAAKKAYFFSAASRSLTCSFTFSSGAPTRASSRSTSVAQ
jgi:hypothetical protein